MAKFSTSNIKKNASGRNMLEVFKTIGIVALAEAIPGAVQAIGGYKADGTPNIKASGSVWDISTGIGAAAIAYGFDKPQYGNAILLTKGIKQVYDNLNPITAKNIGTPLFLPIGSNKAIYNTTGSEKTEGTADSVPVTMPDGTIENVTVQSLPSTLSGYGGYGGGYDVNSAVEMLSEGNPNPFLTSLSDVYTNDALQDIYTDTPLQDMYTNDPLSDVYTNDPLQDEFDFFDAVGEGNFD
jgi:hypothetical protein